MNNVRSIAQGTGTPFGFGLTLNSDAKLAELLTLHEEMIGQLRIDRLNGLATSDFVKGMIEQHETAAARLRAQLQHHEARTALSGQST